jgi:hypothetical protein
MWPLHKGARDTDRDLAIKLYTQTLSLVQNRVEGLVSCCARTAGHDSGHLRKGPQPLFSSTTLDGSASSEFLSRLSAQLLSEFAESGRYIVIRTHRATFDL